MNVQVKDAARYPDKWAFFSFGFSQKTAQANAKARCWECHNEHGGVDTTYVQIFPTLRPVAEKFGTYQPGYMGGMRTEEESGGRSQKSEDLVARTADVAVRVFSARDEAIKFTRRKKGTTELRHRNRTRYDGDDGHRSDADRKIGGPRYSPLHRMPIESFLGFGPEHL